jgi:hypothetical protein
MMKLEGFLYFSQLAPERVAKTVKVIAKDGLDSFAPLGPPADASTWAKVAAHLGDAASKRRLDAQEVAAARAREDERVRERAATDAEAVDMTYLRRDWPGARRVRDRERSVLSRLGRIDHRGCRHGTVADAPAATPTMRRNRPVAGA